MKKFIFTAVLTVMTGFASPAAAFVSAGDYCSFYFETLEDCQDQRMDDTSGAALTKCTYKDGFGYYWCADSNSPYVYKNADECTADCGEGLCVDQGGYISCESCDGELCTNKYDAEATSYYTREDAENGCSEDFREVVSGGLSVYLCVPNVFTNHCVNENTRMSGYYYTQEDCQFVAGHRNDGIKMQCHYNKSNSLWQFASSAPETGHENCSDELCTPNCAYCSSDSNCSYCKSGYTLSGEKCVEDTSGETSGESSCNAGYTNVNGTCVKNDGQTAASNTVENCPSHMKLSADGCCCLYK